MSRAWAVSSRTRSLGDDPALLSPLDSLGETDLLSAHMGQHLLLGDLAAPLLVIGLRTPVYAFLLPRGLLVPVLF